MYCFEDEFCPSCPYCARLELNHDLLAQHFLREHFFVVKKTTCLLCHCLTDNILTHMEQYHTKYCLYCGEYDPRYTHQQCVNRLKKGISFYFQEKIRQLIDSYF